MKASRILAAALMLGGVAFGFWGGEYSTLNWLTLRRNVRAEHFAIDSLRVALDTLRRDASLIETDHATQERVAREQFGMIRPGEILYRIEGSTVDSTGH